METGVNKDMQEEMVGVLTAISIVSRRLAARLKEQNQKEEGRSNDGQK
ncbi:hypothetical protein [Clostridium tyrobutyricum]|nr:hypothetical protein [Clostridium tyrobutyricum]